MSNESYGVTWYVVHFAQMTLSSWGQTNSSCWDLRVVLLIVCSAMHAGAAINDGLWWPNQPEFFLADWNMAEILFWFLQLWVECDSTKRFAKLGLRSSGTVSAPCNGASARAGRDWTRESTRWLLVESSWGHLEKSLEWHLDSHWVQRKTGWLSIDSMDFNRGYCELWNRIWETWYSNPIPRFYEKHSLEIHALLWFSREFPQNWDHFSGVFGLGVGELLDHHRSHVKSSGGQA